MVFFEENNCAARNSQIYKLIEDLIMCQILKNSFLAVWTVGVLYFKKYSLRKKKIMAIIARVVGITQERLLYNYSMPSICMHTQ